MYEIIYWLFFGIITFLIVFSWISIVRANAKLKYMSTDMAYLNSRISRMEERVDGLYRMFVDLVKEKK